jgi:excisionase family DNA binding protein
MTTGRYLTTAHIAYLFGVHPRTVSRWVRSGRLSYVAKLPGKRGAYLFDPEVIHDIARRQEADT